MSRAALLAVLGILACGSPPSPSATEAAPTPALPPTEPARPRPIAPPEPEPVPRLHDPAAFVGKHVLVAAGTRLRTSAKPDATMLVLRETTDDRPAGFAFEVVGHEAGDLVLRRAAADHRCDSGLPELDLVDPQLRLPAAQVMDVLARELDVRAADGTSVRLRPGTAVVRSGEDGIVDVGGMRLHVAVDARAVGNAFVPAMAPRPEGELTTVPMGTPLRYAGTKEVTVRPPLFVDDRGDALVLSRSGVGNDETIEVIAACVTLRAKAGDAGPEPMDPRLVGPGALAGMGLMGGLAGITSTIDAGTEATWHDGSPAGKLARLWRNDGRGRVVAKRLCFAVGDASSALESFELCVARRSVTVDDPMAAMVGLGGYGSLPDDTALLEALTAESGLGVGSLDHALGAEELGGILGSDLDELGREIHLDDAPGAGELAPVDPLDESPSRPE